MVINRKILLGIALAAAIGITGTLIYLNSGADSEFISMESTGGIRKSVEEKQYVQIYVAGEVVRPGIITIEKGSTIYEVVEVCGGFTNEASPNINLVYIINKNVTLVIKNNNDGGGARIIDSPGDAVLIDEENGIIDGKININNADMESLCLLAGIGEKTAGDIIDYREESGPFLKVEDIMKVSGIKENKFNIIKEYICVE